MAIISGDFRIAETADVTRVLLRRLLGWRRFAPLTALAAFLASVLLLINVVEAVAPPGLRVSVFFGALGALGALALYLWTSVWRGVVIGAWRRRGVPDPMPISVETTDEALLFTVAGVATRFPWAEVSEIAPSRTRWVVIAHYSAVGVPRRLFRDQRAERAFVGDILVRLSPAARSRSGEAAAFAAAL